MGGSGSAWTKHKKRAGLRPDAVSEELAHPLFVRAGQRFFPLQSNAASRATLRVTRVLEADGRCTARREDARATTVALTLARLLATTPEGTGRYYRFVGFAPGRRYKTHAQVLGVGDTWTRLVCPEWHPRFPITLASGSVPAGARFAGAWVSCVADLGAAQAAQVGPIELRAVDPVSVADRYHPIVADDGDHDAPSEALSAARDVVLFVDDPELATMAGETAALYLTGHPPECAPGDRVYAHDGRGVRGWRELSRLEALPNGVRLVLTGPWHEVSVPDAPSRPVSGVAGGRHGHQRWAPRTWQRSGERAPDRA
jgi:hypothetical protein